MLKVICLQSSAPDVDVARRELLARADTELGVYRPVAGLLFSSYEQTPAHYDALTGLLAGLQQQFSALNLVGSTVTAGFAGDSGYIKHGFFLMLFISDEVVFRAGLIPDVQQLQSNENGLPAALYETMQLQNSPEHVPRACLIFPAYHQVNGDRLVADVQKVVGDDCVVFGGIASAYWSDAQMDDVAKGGSAEQLNIEDVIQFSIADGNVSLVNDALPYLNLYGDVEVDVQYTHGWSDLGDMHDLVVEGNIIRRINDVNAVSYLKRANHPLVASNNFTNYPFWIHENGRSRYQRDVFYDEDRDLLHIGNLTWDEGVDVKVSFSFPTPKTMKEEYKLMLDGFGDDYDFAFSVACASRVLAQRSTIGEEAQWQGNKFVKTPLIGGYFFGEFFPWQERQNERGAMLHSCTSALLAIRTPASKAAWGVPEDAELSDQDVFLQTNLKQNRAKIAELEEQLSFFEGKQSIKELYLLQDVVAILLNKSRRTVNAHAVELEAFFRDYIDKTGEKLPYAFTRARLIAKLNPLKKAGSEKFFGKKM